MVAHGKLSPDGYTAVPMRVPTTRIQFWYMMRTLRCGACHVNGQLCFCRARSAHRFISHHAFTQTHPAFHSGVTVSCACDHETPFVFSPDTSVAPCGQGRESGCDLESAFGLNGTLTRLKPQSWSDDPLPARSELMPEPGHLAFCILPCRCLDLLARRFQ